MPTRTKATTSTITLMKPTGIVSEVVARLRELQRQRSVIIKSRIMQENRLVAVVAGTVGYHSGMTEAERKKSFTAARAEIAKVRTGESSHPFAGVVRVTLVGIDEFDIMQAALEKEMEKLAGQLPVASWIGPDTDRRGFGLVSLAVVVGECGDLANYANPAKVWRRMGLAPWQFNGKTLMGGTWRGGKEGKLPAAEWEAYGYSPRRRSIAWGIGENIVRSNKTVYRARYEEVKARAAAAHPDWTPKRVDNHARLVATKTLLRDLWVEWNKPGG